MSAEFMTPEWAGEVQQLLAAWPDDQEKADPRKIEQYWAYFERHWKAYEGTFALGVSGIPGAAGTRYLGLTFAGGGAAPVAAILTEAEALAPAPLALACTYPTWSDLVGGYDISKAMTYHQLPLTVGGAADLLRCVYFIHELIVAALRPQIADRLAAVPA
jgi:hypothetical protein